MRKTPGTLLAALVCASLAGACARSDADASITTKIRAKLDADRIVTNPSQIQVTSDKKVVTLSGAVASKEAEDQAVKLARSTEGVKNVVDELKVTPGAAGANAGESTAPPPAPNPPAAPPAK